MSPSGSRLTVSGSPAPTAMGAPGSHGASLPVSSQTYVPSWPATGSPPSAARRASGGASRPATVLDGRMVGAGELAGAADGLPGGGSTAAGAAVGGTAGPHAPTATAATATKVTIAAPRIARDRASSEVLDANGFIILSVNG